MIPEETFPPPPPPPHPRVHTVFLQMLPLNVIRRTTAHLPKTGGEQSEMEDWSESLDASKVRL